MSLSEYHKSIYRSPEDINIRINEIFNSFFSYLKNELNLVSDRVIENLKALEIELMPQIMHVFEAPLDNNDFKDLVRQIIHPFVIEIIEKAYEIGAITSNEFEQIINAINNSNQLDFKKFIN